MNAKDHNVSLGEEMKSIFIFIALTLFSLVPSAIAVAQSLPADGGRLLASNCFQCHGTNGLDGSFDALAGDGQLDMYNKLKDMQRKSARANIMYPHAYGYTDAQLKAISTYFSKLPKP